MRNYVMSVDSWETLAEQCKIVLSGGALAATADLSKVDKTLQVLNFTELVAKLEWVLKTEYVSFPAITPWVLADSMHELQVPAKTVFDNGIVTITWAEPCAGHAVLVGYVQDSQTIES